jgi:hypothetical protein
LIGFGTASVHAFNGDADLLWAAAAVAACIFGLVLPRSRECLGTAWIGVVVASLTKNEGLTAALLLAVLVSFRYIPSPEWNGWLTSIPSTSREPWRPRRTDVGLTIWAYRALLMATMVIPGCAWALVVRLAGIQDRFFGHPGNETFGYRVHATLREMSSNLHVLPVALAVLVVGSLVLHGTRRDLGLGNPAWVWIAIAGSLAVILGTYVLGSYEINWWLSTSVSRTTIFAQLALYSDLAIWLLVALSRPRRTESARYGASAFADSSRVERSAAPPSGVKVAGVSTTYATRLDER